MNPYFKRSSIAAAIAACLALLAYKNRAADVDQQAVNQDSNIKSFQTANPTPNIAIKQSETSNAVNATSPSLSALEASKPAYAPQQSGLSVLDVEAYGDLPPLYYIDYEDSSPGELLLAGEMEGDEVSAQNILPPIPLATSENTSRNNGGANIRTNGSIPEGFEALTNMQTTLADFYFGDRLVDSAEVSYNHEYVEITNPVELIRKIPGVLEPEIVAQALSGQISPNIAQICLTGRDTSCGRLSPDIAGVIFNADEFRADIFIDPEYLETRLQAHSKFLPESSSDLGIIQGLTATTSGVTGTQSDSNNYTLYGNTLLGWKENHIVSEWDVSKNNDFSFETLYAERDTQGMLYGAGYLSSSAIMTPEFSTNQRLLGVRMGTSSNSRTDSGNVSATPVQFFASGRNRVEVVRDDRLIYSTTVDAGNQELDTSSFPNGAYEITVRVYDGSVLVQEFTRFFVKTMRIPPADELLWYIEGGEIVRRDREKTIPDSADEWLVRGAIGTRLAERASLTMIGTTTSEERTFEAETYFQGHNWDVSVTGMIGNNDAKGAAVDSYVSLGDVTGNYYFRRLWNNNYDAANALQLLSSSYETHSLSVTSPFMKGYLSYSLNHNVDQDNESTTTNTVTWNKNVWRASSYILNLQFNYSQSNDNKLGLATLTLRNRGRNWSANVRGQGRWEQDDSSSGRRSGGGAVDARWYHDDMQNGAAEIGVAYEDLTADQVLSGDIKYDSSLFGAEFNADHIISGNRDNFTNYNGRASTTLAFNTDSAGIGGSNIAKSAALVSIEGSEQSTFDVMVNNSPSGFVRGGGTTVMPLSPFATYQVGIRPRGDGLHSYDATTREITLYPGNVETLSFSTSREEVVIGKLVDNDGNALMGQTISADADTVVTDEFGLFQIRIAEGTTTLEVAVDNDSPCTMELPANYSKRAGIGVVGSVGCY